LYYQIEKALKRKIYEASPTAAAMMSIAMRVKALFTLVCRFIIRSLPFGIESVNSHK